MFRKIMMSAAAAAALAGVCATANAQGTVVPLEIEGPLSLYTATTTTSGELTVMNSKVLVNSATEFVSPTGARSSILRPNGSPLFNVTQWMRGATYNGQVRPGLIGSTVIVTGEYDTATGLITASEVFSDISENVVLGVVTDANCTTAQCDGTNDYIRGNGATGPVFIPNKDPRLTALPITDGGLFRLNLTRGAPNALVGTAAAPTTFGGEGYFSQNKIFPIGSPTPQEQALVYWAFELGEARPDLIANPGIPEISSLRIRCTEGSRIEVRGFVHAPVNPDGSPAGGAGMPTSGGVGRIRVVMTTDAGTTTYLDEDGAPPTADLPATYGVYRLRADVTDCGTSANVYWDRPNGVGAPWAQVLNVPVDRLREE
jgi:hypothetical protein